jgi:hypothetical protein
MGGDNLQHSNNGPSSSNPAVPDRIGVESLYPWALTDANGKTLTGGSKYLIQFKPAQIPPVNKLGFWSITAYNSTQRLVPNPINRYTPGITYNNDGSLDIYHLLAQ